MDTIEKFLVRELAHYYHDTAHKKSSADHTVRDVLIHELANVDHHIRRLNMDLEQFMECDGHHGEGLRNMLRVQRNHRELIEELMAQSGGDVELLLECQRRLLKAEHDYEQIARRGYVPGSACADQWWDSLNRMEYLGFLNRQVIRVIDGD
jgi:hypothetical protein